MADESTHYLLVCRECGDDETALPVPFGSARERGQWAAAHKAATGHDRWWVHDDPIQPQILTTHIRNIDRVIQFSPAGEPVDGALIELTNGVDRELVLVHRLQSGGVWDHAADVERGISGTQPRNWTAGTAWRYVRTPRTTAPAPGRD